MLPRHVEVTTAKKNPPPIHFQRPVVTHSTYKPPVFLVASDPSKRILSLERLYQLHPKYLPYLTLKPSVERRNGGALFVPSIKYRELCRNWKAPSLFFFFFFFAVLYLTEPIYIDRQTGRIFRCSMHTHTLSLFLSA